MEPAPSFIPVSSAAPEAPLKKISPTGGTKFRTSGLHIQEALRIRRLPKGGESMTDQQIISLFQARDERAVSELSRKYSKTILQIARRHLRSQADAEECANDVMLALWQSIPPAVPNSLEAFIVTVTQRTAIKMAERQQAKKRGGGAGTESLAELYTEIPSHDDVEDTIQQRILTAAVERFLRTLDDDAQTIFVEHWHGGSPPREIAAKFGISGVHVRKSLMQTRRKLRHFLNEEGLL